MKRFLVLLVPILLLFASSVQGQATKNAPYPYAIYSGMKKELSELEWMLVQVNLKLGEFGYFVYFDNKLNLFKVDKFINTSTLDSTAPDVLRKLLLSQCNLVEAVIGSEIPGFRESNSKDLNIKFIIGEPSARHFASYSLGSFSFTDEYYSYRKEKGK